jgi:4'-phosphopantetheinyl transferase
MTPEIFPNPPPRNLELVNGEAHVFCAALDQPLSRLERFEAILSANERARAARFVFTPDRNRFVAARAILREILAWLLHANPAQLAFTYGVHGKPRLASPVAGQFLHFNLAHSDALAVYIVSAQNAVGIDVERIRPIRGVRAIVAQFFSARENAEWRLLSAGRKTTAFFEYWTCKEALLKAAGNGLDQQLKLLNQIEIVPPCDAVSQLNSAKVASEFSDFSVYLLKPARGYQAAAAIKNSRAPYCWKWPA